jgi:acetylornithine deacetylase/succinyl-diaminopimelate desuccinylase-like protein
MTTVLQLLRDMIAIPSVNLSRVGIQTVVCGPGNIAQARTANEFVEIEQVELATRMYKHMLAAWQHG